MAQLSPWAPLSSDRREIRLLDLAPESRDANELSCSLRNASLDDKPAYEALSYVWGEKADPPDVLCVGNEKYEITRNLFEALHSLRRGDEVRVLWVDAVCIRQSNDEERCWQVSMMGDIYKNSQMVLVWLGSRDGDVIRDILFHASDMPVEKHFTEFPRTIMELIKLNSWWRRAWTLQEAVLAPSLTFCSGKECCSEEDFLRYSQLLEEHFIGRDACCEPLLGNPFPVDSNIRTLVDTSTQIMDVFIIRFKHMYGDEAADFLRLTLDHQNREATDARDHIFAYMGMAKRSSIPPNLVQYGLPVLHTLVNAASEIIKWSNSIEVIRHAANPLLSEEDCPDLSEYIPRAGGRDSLRRLQGLPSWCPDWTQRIPDKILRDMKQYRQQMLGRFGAGTSHPANPVFHSDDCLGVTGIKCDRILLTGRCDLWSFTHDARVTLRQWCYMVANSLAHRIAQCDGCGKSIYGVRFSCQSCEHFDFCSRCKQRSPVLHAAEHTFSQLYFKNTVNERNAEDWDDLIKEAKQKTAELRMVPDGKVESTGDVTLWFPNSSWPQLSYIDYPFTDGDSIQDAFRRTLLADHSIRRIHRAGVGEPLSAVDEMAAFLDLWYKWIEGCPFVTRAAMNGKFSQSTLIDALDRVTDKEKSLILRRMEYTLDRRRMVVSQKGYIGVAPAGTRIGDLICVLHGCEMPFILRDWSPGGDPTPASETAEDYVLVGEAYVHGLMHGEAIAAADAGELERVHMVLH